MKLLKLNILFIFVISISLFAQYGTLQFIGPSGGNITAINGTSNADNILIGVKDKGIFYSSTSGNLWTQSDLKDGIIYSFAFNPTNSQIVFAATNTGLWKSINGGKNWISTRLIGKINSIAISSKNANIIFAGANRLDTSGFARSFDGGENWQFSNTGLSIEAKNVSSIAIDPVNDSLVYIGTFGSGVFQSNNKGTSWIEMNSNHSTLPNFHSRKRINSLLLSQDGNFPNSVIIGTDDGVYFSLTRGGSWLSLKLGLEQSDSVVKQLSIISDNPNDLRGPNSMFMVTIPSSNLLNTYPSSSGFYSSAILQGAFQSWQAKFQQVIYNQCFFIPQNIPTTVFLGTSDGIYYSKNKGSNWERKNFGLKFVETSKIASSKYGDTLFISSMGGGMYRSINFGVSWSSINNGIEDPFVNNFEVDPINSSVLYSVNRLNFYKSTNAGEKWNKISISSVNSEITNNDFSGQLFLSKRNSKNIIVHSSRTETQYSLDYGVSWQRLNMPSAASTKLLNGTVVFHSKLDNTILLSSNGIWQTSDFGTNWKNITGNLPLTNNFGNAVHAFRIFTHPALDSLIYVARSDGNKPELMYKTADLQNWFSVNLEINSLLLHKTKPNNLFASSYNKTYFSDNAGLSWISTTSDTTHSLVSRVSASSVDKFLFYLATKGGAYTEYYSKDPAILISNKNIDVGSLSVGESKNIFLTFKNVGSQDLTVRIDSLDNAKDYFGKKNQLITIKPNTTGVQSIIYQPLTSGILSSNIYFTTNDPENSSIQLLLNGKGITKTIIPKKILIDSLHGLSFSDTGLTVPKYFNGLIKSLGESGMSVTSNQSSFDTTGFDAIILPSPKSKYDQREILSIIKYVMGGGFLVLLADQSSNEGNKYLNEILTDFRWKADYKDSTGLLIQTDRYIVDSVLAFQGNPLNIVARQFANKAHPFLNNVDTLVLFGSTNILAQEGKANIFLRGEASTFSINSVTNKPDSLRPTLIAISQVGKGTILVLGDMDIWSEKKLNNVTTTGNIISGLFAKSNLTFALNIFSSKQNYEVKLPQQTLSERYLLLTIPFDLNSFNITQVLKDLGSINPINWRLWKWESEKQVFVEFPNPAFTTFKRGEGYWLITKGEKSLNLGNATLTSSTGYHEIKLYPGYNLIGNPFPYTVSWENSKRDSGIENKLWRWNKTRYEAVTTNLLPFEGYWVKNTSTQILKVLINPAKISGTGKIDPRNSISSSKWSLKLRALSLVATDEDNFIGMHPEAKIAKDEFDFSEPPIAPTNYLQLAFRKNNWKENPGLYSSDFRPISEEGDYWDFEVSSNLHSLETKLVYEIEKELPEGFKVMLLDKSEERIYNITNSTYNFIFRKNQLTRNFRILIGRESFISQNSEGVPLIPPDYTLKQNYPNPFNPQTSIQYSLSYSGDVEIVIYNTLGQRVKGLVSQHQKIGTYSINWNGKDEFGLNVSAGIYFYRIKTGNYLATKKMLLIK